MFETNTKQTRVKNLNMQEADQLAIFKLERGVGLGATENKASWCSERDSVNPDLRISSPALHSMKIGIYVKLKVVKSGVKLVIQLYTRFKCC